ncbi:MAG: solute carrier family 26 protein, partial [Bacteroidota bacterium]
MVKKYFPILEWLPSYGREEFAGDWAAGLTVGVMLIPQGMAYAMLAGLPPIYGLYAATVPLIMYAIFGTSRQLAVGPVALVSLLTASGVGQFAEVGSEEFIALTLLLSMLVGLIRFGMGLFRLGFLVNFLSHPVISGFTSAAALIIGLNQLKHLLGLDIPRSNQVHRILIDAIGSLQAVHWPTLILGLGGILIITQSKKLHRSIPGALIAVVFGILIVYGFDLHEAGVSIVGTVPSGLPGFEVPRWSWSDAKALFPIALTISLIGFVESIAIARSIQLKHRNYEIDSNQELIGLGMANIAGAFFQSFPTTGGFSRSAVNDQAGAKTGMASLISASLMVLTLLFLTPLFYYLPNALLASVIMVAVFGLIDWREAWHLWRHDRRDFIMLTVTFVATLAGGIQEGILLGLVLSLGLVIYRSSDPHMAVLGRIPGTDIFRNVKRFPQVEIDEQVAILRFDAQLFFANINHFREEVDRLVRTKPQLRHFLISAEAINALDSSAVHMLHQLVEDFESQQIQLVFSAVKGPVRDVFHRNGLVERIGASNFFTSTADAVGAIEKRQS